MKNYKLFLFALITVLCSSCSIFKSDTSEKEKPVFLLLHYSDFGPPQLAEELLGKYQWQWDSSENHKPQKYDIQVVVYRGENISDVKKLYPVSEAGNNDYRYVSYGEARVWLNQKIKFFEADIASGDESNLALMYPFLREYYLALISVEKNF